VDASLDALGKIEAHRKIVVLGDMLELGNEETSAHREVGRAVAEASVDYFIAVGNRMKEAANEFRRVAINDGSLVEFKTPMEAGTFIQHLIEEGDVVLIKGSQGMRMEKVVEEIMANPNIKTQLLVRQDDVWKDIEFIQP
jgi:UDP-N-acetylmuramoyl-tripeptide--D-alanyl-D-alanine ligase